MSLATQLTAIETHAITVGATFTPPLTDVCVGLPVPRGRCVRVYWDGEAEPVRMPGRFTLMSELVADRVVVRGFWPIASADEAAHRGRVLEMAALAHGMRTAIDMDQDLADGLDAIDVEHAEPDIVQIGGALFAVVDIPVTLSYREQEIAR